MPTVVQTQLRDDLLAQAPHTARAWLRALNTTTPLANHPSDLMDYLLDIIKQITSLLFDEPFNRHQARTLGVTLAGLWSHDPLVLGRSQEVLGGALSGQLPPDQTTTLFPRLSSILAELAVGFMAAAGEQLQAHPIAPEQAFSTESAVELTLEQELADKERKLAQLKQRFSTLIMHEFRTPMATIMAAADLLRHYEHQLTNSRRHELFDSIQTEIRDLDRLLSDILLVSTAQSYGLQFTPSPVNLEDFCRKAIAETLSRIHAPASRVILSIQDSNNAQLETLVDEDLFRNILSRLLLNAILYSSHESTVSVELIYDDKSLTVRVRDQGHGISQKDQQHIFDTFYRGENIGFMPGLGLGLTLVKQCVTAHQGTITFETREGQGTTFIVRLPLNSPDPATE